MFSLRRWLFGDRRGSLNADSLVAIAREVNRPLLEAACNPQRDPTATGECEESDTIRFDALTPTQLGVLLLAGHNCDGLETNEKERLKLMRRGRGALVACTGRDFGYDLREWRKFLIRHGKKFGYTNAAAYPALDRVIRDAEDDPELQRLARVLKSG